MTMFSRRYGRGLEAFPSCWCEKYDHHRRQPPRISRSNQARKAAQCVVKKSPQYIKKARSDRVELKNCMLQLDVIPQDPQNSKSSKQGLMVISLPLTSSYPKTSRARAASWRSENVASVRLFYCSQLSTADVVSLDYDRTHFAMPDTQKKFFRLSSLRSLPRLAADLGEASGLQLSLAKKYHLPLFLHSRAAHADFVNILREEGFGEDGGRKVGANGGVVHSFTGTKSEVEELVRLAQIHQRCLSE